MPGRSSLVLCVTLVGFALQAHADHLQFSYTLPAAHFTRSAEGGTLNLPGSHRHGIAGAPDLPVWPLQLLLPAGHEAISLNVRYEDVELQSVDPLRPSQQAVPISQSQLARRTRPDEQIYNRDAFWPESDYAHLSTSALGGHCIALADLYPLRYNAVSGEFSFAHRIVVDVETAPGERFLPPRAEFQRELSGRIDNAQAMADYRYCMDASRTDPVEMLIITDSSLESAFQPLADYKNSLGLSCEIQSIDEILAAQNGRDNAEKLRNHLIAQYEERNIRYVLLGGDTEVIPYRSLYVDTGYDTADHLPSDFYFAALDGDWNSDGDNRWGEPGEEDWYAELAVGRASVSTTTEAQNFVHKQISYQSNPVLADVSQYRMVGEELNDDPQTWGGDSKDEVAAGSSTYGITTAGFPPSVTTSTLYDRDHTWVKTELFSALANGVNFSNHLGHSNWNYVMKFGNSDVTTANFPSDGVNHSYHLGYSQGCIPGAFEYNDCILEHLTNLSTGYAAFIGNSRYGWYSPGQTSGPSQFFDREFFDALFDEGIRELAAANNDSKHDLVSWANSDGIMRWCYYELNLFGDPGLIPWSSAPCVLQVDVENEVLPGTNSLSLLLNLTGQSPAGTRVSLLDAGGNILGTTTANAFGEATLQLDAPMTEIADYELVVSGYNLLVHRETIRLSEPAEAHLVANAMLIEDTNGNGALEAGEEASLFLNLHNYGGADATNAGLQLLESEDYEVVQGSLAFENSIASGGDATPATPLVIRPRFDLEDGTDLTLFFAASADNGYWEFELSRTVLSPLYALGSLTAEDTANGHLDPQESSQLILELQNEGQGSYLDGEAELLCSIGGVDISTSILPVGDLSHGASLQLPFALNIGGTLQAGDLLDFSFRVRDEQNNLRFEQDFVLQLGEVAVGFESGALDELSWESEDTVWSVISSGAAEGGYCARSASIGHNSSSGLFFDLGFDCITRVAFQYRVSSEEGDDLLRFEVDGQTVASWSGEEGWDSYSVNVSPGLHRIGWRYVKDNAYSSGQDCAWLDDIQIGPAPQARIYCDTESIHTTVAAGSSGSIDLVLSNTGSDDLHWQAALLEQITRSFSDDMEEGEGGWSHDGSNDDWHLSTQRAYSGSTSWHCGIDGGDYQNNTHAWLVSPTFFVEPQATFGFRHWLEMELGSPTHAWDGALVEISLAESDTWTSINPLGGYPYLAQPNVDSPFDPYTPIYSGSVDWEQEEFDLADYAGQLVRVRFRFGSDAGNSAEGWYIDDVRINGLTVEWLSLDPAAGTILPEESQTLTLAVDTNDLDLGVHEARLFFASDAINDPSLALPVTLIVGVAEPVDDLQISWTAPYVCLHWTALSGTPVYRIQRSGEPYGDYITVGTTTNAFWQERMPRFPVGYYRVIVER